MADPLTSIHSSKAGRPGPLGDDFIQVACPQCQSSDYDRLFDCKPNQPTLPGTFPVGRCRACGLAYANPRLGDAALTAAYTACGAAEADARAPSTPPGPFTRWWRHTTQRQVVGDWVQQGPVLDVGCNNGDLMLAVRERGLEVAGIETSATGVRVCRDRGLQVTQGRWEDVSLPDETLGTILMSHVLEHFGDPLRALEKARRALRPGGRIVIAVPNSRGAVARLFRSHWHGWDPPYHLTHFDPRALATMLGRAGFKVTHLSTRGVPDDVTRSLAKAFHRPVRALWFRAGLLPASWLLGRFTLGGELCAVAERLSAAPGGV